MNGPAVVIFLACAIGVWSIPMPRGPLDSTVEKLINDIRPKLVDLVLPNIDAHINSSGINIDLTTANITTNHLENFTIAELKTTLLPLKLNILTLVWDEVSLSGGYNLNGVLDIPGLKGPVEIDAEGNASILLKNITFSVGATIRTPDGHIQIGTITLLKVGLTESIVNLDNLLGDDDLDLVVNVFLGFFVTEFINDFGNDVLKALEPTIIEEVNKILANIDFP